MNPLELKVARQTLGLSQTEAAEHIGGVTKRSWNYFESGGRAIKPDIVEKISALIERRRQALDEAISKSRFANGKLQIAVLYYDTPEYCGGVVDWRFSQSIAITLWADFGAKLVRFDPEKYKRWLEEKQIQDTEQARASWAAYQ